MSSFALSSAVSTEAPVAAGSTADRLLDAAERVILALGVGRLTLDAVAQAAGISKGGLLYHFPSKDALVDGMIERLCDRFDDLVRVTIAGDPEPRGRVTRALIRATCALYRPSAPTGQVGGPAGCRMALGLLAAASGGEAQLEPLRSRYSLWRARAENDGIDTADAAIVQLALDGLWFADLFHLPAPEGQRLERVVARLTALTRTGPPQIDEPTAPQPRLEIVSC